MRVVVRYTCRADLHAALCQLLHNAGPMDMPYHAKAWRADPHHPCYLCDKEAEYRLSGLA
jgi:hypothetical protein